MIRLVRHDLVSKDFGLGVSAILTFLAVFIEYVTPKHVTWLICVGPNVFFSYVAFVEFIKKSGTQLSRIKLKELMFSVTVANESQGFLGILPKKNHPSG